MSNKTRKFLANKLDNNSRLDVFLNKKLNLLTRSLIKKFILTDNVKINNKIINLPSKKIKDKDLVQIKIEQKKSSYLKPSKIKLDIVYEDKDLIIINKPKGMVVHPGAGNTKSTLANALVHKFKKNLSNVNGKDRPGIIHRIDKETSGLLVVAKNNFSHAKLGKQFSDHTIKRSYLCLVWGVIRPLYGRIETLIARDKRNRQLMIANEIRGKKAITNYKTLKVFNIKDIPKISLIECSLETGRTHQIRVHMKYKGTSLLGDQQYGKKNVKFKKINQNFLEVLSSFNGQALHAKNLGFIHPTSNKFIEFDSKLSKDFKKLLNLLEKLGS